jgi:hypothetical protein
MSQLIQSFYKNVQTICMTDNESDLINYLSQNGLILLQQILNTEINVTIENKLFLIDFFS